MTRAERKAFEAKLYKGYGLFFLALLLVIGIIMYLEIGAGLGNTADGRRFIGIFFILLSFGLYAVVGIANFTKKFDEYYVAGRKVPAFFNGMATGADWMSAASFISMAGSIWLLGYDGLAYVMGWTGGYVILALFFAPYIRKFGQFTIPDFVAARFAEKGNAARLVAAICAIIVSFTYVTAQVTGVGIIMSRFFGVDYLLGVFLGLAGVVLCSFLGGMKSITWTQVAQYIILITAYLIPVSWLALRFTGFPIAELMYGQALQAITSLEQAQGITPSYVQPFTTALSNASARTALPQLGLPAPELQTVRSWIGTPLGIHGADLLPHGGYGRPAAHPDPLLHRARSAAGAHERRLVAVLHLPAVLHRAGVRRVLALGNPPEPRWTTGGVAAWMGWQLECDRPADDSRCAPTWAAMAMASCSSASWGSWPI